MILLAPEILGTPLGEALAEPERLLAAPAARFVKDHRRTAVAAVTIGGREVFIKRFKPYAWYRRLEWMVAATPAKRCWRLSAELEQAGFRVAPPLGVVERKRYGLPVDSYFLTASLAGAEPVGRWWLERGRSLSPAARYPVIGALARELRRFHDAGFYSRDANADNFLLRIDGAGRADFFLLDLENVHRFRRVSQRRRVKNLVQLHRPIRGQVRRLDQLRFLRAYAGRALRELRGWLALLERADERKEAKYRRRRLRRGSD